MPANKNRSKTITTISASDKRVHVWWLIAAIHLPASSLFPSAPCTVLTTIAMQQDPAYQAYYHGHTDTIHPLQHTARALLY